MRPVAMVAALIALAFAAPAGSQDSKVYAALNANNEGNLQVRWGATAAEAKQRAAEACREVSKPSPNDPPSTNEVDVFFVYSCCAAPAVSCAPPSHESRERA